MIDDPAAFLNYFRSIQPRTCRDVVALPASAERWEPTVGDGENGWGIGSPDFCDDKLDAESLYQLLENEVIPTFYNDRSKWKDMMRESINTAVDFTAHRMIKEYQLKFYGEKF